MYCVGEYVGLSEDGLLARNISTNERTKLWSGGMGITPWYEWDRAGDTMGRHYFEVEVAESGGLAVGICRPNLELDHEHWAMPESDGGWCMSTATKGALYGNGKSFGDEAGSCDKDDRADVLLGLNKSSLLLFKNGVWSAARSRLPSAASQGQC
jgi:hypothetical protein